MIAAAAWRPKGHRHVFGVADLARGAFSASLHEMADAWGWPVTNVHRFLHRLVREAMVELAHAPVGLSGKGTGKGHARSRHIITICNYEQYQARAARAEKEAEKEPDHDLPQLPGIITQPATQQDKPREPLVRQEAAGRPPARDGSATSGKPKPPHGVKSRSGAVQWFDYASPEWRAAAELQEAETGAKVFPKAYRDGRGNWFKTRSPQDWKAWGQAVTRRASR